MANNMNNIKLNEFFKGMKLILVLLITVVSLCINFILVEDKSLKYFGDCQFYENAVLFDSIRPQMIHEYGYGFSFIDKIGNDLISDGTEITQVEGTRIKVQKIISYTFDSTSLTALVEGDTNNYYNVKIQKYLIGGVFLKTYPTTNSYRKGWYVIDAKYIDCHYHNRNRYEVIVALCIIAIVLIIFKGGVKKGNKACKLV